MLSSQPSANRVHRFWPAFVSLAYGILASLWIVVSDYLLLGHPVQLPIFETQTWKGVLFVVVTGVLLYLTLRRIQRHQIRSLRSVALSQAALDRSQQPVLIFDCDGAILYANLSCRILLGLDLAMPPDFRIDALAPGLSRESWQSRWDHLASSGALRVETFVVKPGGQTVQVEIMASTVVHGGELWGFAIIHDIGERKAVEASLRDSERSHRALFDGNPQSMWVYDLATLRLLAVNEAAIRDYGYAREEFLQMTIDQIRPTGESDRLRSIDEESSDDLHYACVWRHKCKDGSFREVSIRSHRLDWGGRPARLVVGQDVTLQLRAEQALRESEQRFRKALDEAPFPICLHAEDGTLLSLNQR